MICAECREKIDVQNEDFEEVGSIEFMHTKCIDKVLERKSWSGDEETTKGTMNSSTASREWVD
jgi:hypothetical protein